MKEYILKKPAVATANKGRGGCGAPAPPASALIYQESNSGIEPPAVAIRDEFQAEQDRQAVTAVMDQLPGRLRKKMFAIRTRIEFLVQTYGLERVGLQTLTIRENVTDRKEFQRRFKSISTNVFPKIYEDWIRVFERQQRGAWHAHVVVATKRDIRTGTDVVALNQLLKDHRDRKIPKHVYYSGLQRFASPNLRAIWKEFRHLCGIREFKKRRKGGRYYKFDACHLLPIVNSAKALATYVSKYISKGFQNRRPEDKGVRLVGCTKRLAKVCGERFAWVSGAGSLWRTKLGLLAGMMQFESMDDFAKKLGPRWAYHIRPAIDALMLPHYETMKLARADGWDLVNTSDGSPWPWENLDLPRQQVQQSRTRAFRLLTDLLLRRQRSRGQRRLDDEPNEKPRLFKPPAKPSEWRQHEFDLALSQIVRD